MLSKYYKVKDPKLSINIEGLAYKDEKLFVGLRSPVINNKAQILEFSSTIFDQKIVISKRYEIGLGENTGIRSLEFDGENLFILAGADDTKNLG